MAPFHPAGDNPTLALERDLQLIDHLDRLPAGRLDASVPGTYGSMIDTLTHMIDADSRYLLRLRDPTPPLADDRVGVERHWTEACTQQRMKRECVLGAVQAVLVVHSSSPHHLAVVAGPLPIELTVGPPLSSKRPVVRNPNRS